MTFQESTQHLNWMFTSEYLENLRQQSSDRVPSLTSNGIPVPKLSLSEEKIIRLHFANYIVHSVSKGGPTMKNVMITALYFYNRIYSQCSVMEYPPHEIVPAIIFLSMKVEEVKISVEDCAVNFNLNKNLILSKEFLVMSLLKFNLYLHLPLKPILGFLHQLKKLNLISEIQSHTEAIEKVITSLCLDSIPLTNSPSQIALAAIRITLGKDTVDKLIHSYYHGSSSITNGILDSIDQELRDLNAVLSSLTNDLVDNLMHRLSQCRNPEFDENSAVYKEKKRREEEITQNKQREKIFKAEQKMKEDYEALIGAPLPKTSSFSVIDLGDSP
ncbi:hypothetical protein P9112_007239 [Eukaryota sp. TZLM1-RC]